MEAYQKRIFNISKTDADKQLVFGWASIAEDESGAEVVDLQGDIISAADLEDAAYDHVLNFRSTGERHDPNLREKGRLVESVVLTAEKQKAMGIPAGIIPIGWWVGYKIDDLSTWERVKSGDYKAFSVEGKGERTPVEKSGTAAKTFEEFYREIAT